MGIIRYFIGKTLNAMDYLKKRGDTRLLGKASDWQSEVGRFDSVRLHQNQKTA